jgi:hypothetical protein
MRFAALACLGFAFAVSAFPQAGTFSLKSGQTANCTEPSATPCSLPNNVTAGDTVVIDFVADIAPWVAPTPGALYFADGNGIPGSILLTYEPSGALSTYTAYWPFSPGGSKAFSANNAGAYDQMTVAEFAPSAGSAIAVDGACTNLSGTSTNAACTATAGGAGDLAYQNNFTEGNFTAISGGWTQLGCNYLCDGYIANTASTSLTSGFTPTGQGPGSAQVLALRLISGNQVTYTSINVPIDKTSSLASPVTIGSFRVSSQGSNLCAVAALRLYGTTLSLTGVTLGGTSMTSAGAPPSQGSAYSALYYLAAPPTGSSEALILTYTGTLTEAIADVSTFQQCNQTTPVRSGSYTSANGTLSGTTPVSLTVTSSTTDMSVTTGGCTANPAFPNQMWDGAYQGTHVFLGMDHAVVPASTVTHTWTCKQSGDTYTFAGLSLQTVATATKSNAMALIGVGP